ncbi:flagellar hook-associated protein FlgK [Hansschlegelia quercus]|uniref:Flagellar hook-associated protein 1 n=1 Tax=Hansschlegelia quercus TaxID=2528245 RepID=A0A4Q9GL01_9HYPH|nr:flagellar hook-associated protein FlgK [Hansschlegelia quercus]TBN55069.1 flagellar hook-associated protein FlgK [Hansschlegelia quercus]
MSTLNSALSSALSGLRTTQAGLELVSTNVANATTAGYVRKTLTTTETTAGGESNGVKTAEITRQIDIYLQRQLRTETSGAAYASTKSKYLDTLQTTFGTPGSALSLDTAVSNFQTSLDALAASPDDGSARSAVLAQAQVMAQTLNSTSSAVQSLRSDADNGIASSVDSANQALKTIESLSKQIVQAKIKGSSASGLEDMRDQAIDTLSQLIDLRVEDRGSGDIAIKTGSGLSLYDGGKASELSFTAATPMTPSTTYPGTLSGVMLTRGDGAPTDLLKSSNLRSGSIKALAEIRDQTGPQAQRQLDEMAANLAQTLGTKTVPAATVAGGVDLSTQGAQPGDQLNATYTVGGVTKTLTIVNVGDPSKLPLSDKVTADPNDTVIGVDFSAPDAAAQLTTALSGKGLSMTAAATATGFALTTTDATTTAVTAGQSAITATALSGDGLALPMFVDGDAGQVYSGSLDGSSQITGFAGRIQVNGALLDDPTALTSYATDTTAADEARPTFLRDALKAQRSFGSDTGLSGTSSSYKGSLVQYAAAAINFQAAASSTAAGVADGQSLVVSTLSDRFTATSGVDVDDEMTNLITLQTAYSANARVITAVKDMMDMLLRI